MNEAVGRMLERYEFHGTEDYTRALREIFQELALLGLWRAKFFERAAFYGGTALRILHGLDRFSEDLDFSLLTPDLDFDLGRYLAGLERELAAFGLAVTVTTKPKTARAPCGPHSSRPARWNTCSQLAPAPLSPEACLATRLSR